MRIEDIEIHAGGITRPHKVIGEIKAKVGAATLLSKTPTIEDVNFKLREYAIKKGANAIINVKYDRGMSLTSWKALTATGTAVFAESDEVKCPFCAEPIKREAIKCKHCGADLPRT
jgi:zinc ribbon protein/putative heavy-metal-binding protein